MFSANMNRITLLKLSSLAALTAVSFSLMGCEEAEDRQLAAAQTCLDEARDSDGADRCLTIVEGLESQSAYLIRCSANFIAQGFTGSRVADAFNQMKNSPEGTDPTATMLSFVVFAKSLPNHTASKAMSNCQKSGVNSMLQLATVAKMATLIADPSGLANLAGSAFDPASGSFNTEQLATQISNLVSNATAEQKEEIGTIAQTASEAYCGAGSAYKTEDICTKLDQAVASSNGDLTQLGADLLNLLKQQAP